MSARDLLQRATGLNLTESVAERAVQQRMAALGIGTREQYLPLLASDELKALIELVVVPESWMFREPEAFGAAAAFVARHLAAKRERGVRILSLPCAGGEEPYSLAMALSDAGVPASAYSIDAIDLSEAALARARQGRYTRNAFRGKDLAFRERYFVQQGDEYQIDEQLRSQVRFGQGNLLGAENIANAGFYDVIFCRNLLIYFDIPTTAAAIAKLYALLADDGLLFAGYAEVPLFCQNRFASLRLPGAFALQKKSAAAGARAPKARCEPGAARARTSAAAPAPAKPAAVPAASEAPGVAALLAQARRQADQGELATAAAACHAVLASEPDSADAYFILGMVSECEKKIGVADDYWRRCVYLQPDHYEALCHLALLTEQAGDAAQAAALKQRAARIYQRQQHGSSGKTSP
ncbi:MAG: protein-glutamate O-methyltransferase CheR [Telluria sp.]|nr:protein-glutamate O-methyltransferase CheR [Telluria sp.]